MLEIIRINSVVTFLISLILTVVALRIALFLMPFRNFDLAGHNVHHLFVGSVIIMMVIVAFVCELQHRFFLILAGIGSGLVLDEIIYLIATDGSDLAYLTPVSLIGSFIFVSLMISAILIIFVAKRRA